MELVAMELTASYNVYVSTQEIGRQDRINDHPTSLIDARRMLYAFATLLQKAPKVHDIQTDVWLSEEGEICEGVRWHCAKSDDEEGCDFSAHIARHVEHELDETCDWE